MFAQVVRRIVTIALGAVSAVVGVLVIFGALGQITAQHFDVMGLSVSTAFSELAFPARLGWSMIGGGLFGVGVFLVAAGIQVSRGGSDGLVLLRYDAFPGGGELSISADAVRSIVARASMETPGVCSVIPTIRLRRRGWDIRCEIVVASDAELAALGGDIRERVQKTLERHTGIPVYELRVKSALSIAGNGRVR